MQNTSKDAFDQIRTLKQGFESLEGRNEQSKNMMARVPFLKYVDPASQDIDNIASKLSSTFGGATIDKNYTNQQNRVALQTMFHNNVMDIVKDLKQKASNSGDINATFAVYDLANKLISMPLKDYNSSVVYQILNELDQLGDKVVLGVDISSAMKNSSTINNLSTLHNNYMDKFKSEQFQICDESVSTFLKSALVGGSRSAASTLDRVGSVVKYVIGADDAHSLILENVNKLLPDLTRSEERSITGQAGSYVGSFATAMAVYGLPKSPQELLLYASLPLGIDLLSSVLGISDSDMDKMLGIADGYTIYNRGMSLGKYINKTLIQSNYPSIKDGNIGIKIDKSSPSEMVSDLIKGTGENMSNMNKEQSRSFADSAEQIYNNPEKYADSNIDSPVRNNTATDNILKESVKMNTHIPDLYIGISDKTKEISHAIGELHNSQIPENVAIAKDYLKSSTETVNNSILRSMIGEDFESISNNKIDTGEAFGNMIEEVKSSFDLESDKLYAENRREIRKIKTLNSDSNIMKEISSQKNQLKEQILGTEGLSSDKKIERLAYIKELKTEMQHLDSCMDQLDEAINNNNLEGIGIAYNRLSREAQSTRRELAKSHKTSVKRLINETISIIRDNKDKFYNTIAEYYPSTANKIQTADRYYKDSIGKLNDIIGKGKSGSKDINYIRNKKPEQLYTMASQNISMLKDINSLISNIAPNNKPLLTSYNSMINNLYAHELYKSKLVPNSSDIRGTTVMKKNLAGGSILAKLLAIDPSRAKIAAEFAKLGENLDSNLRTKFNPSQTGVYLENLLRNSFNKVPIVGSIVGKLLDMPKEAKLKMYKKEITHALNNPSSNNIGESIRIAQQIKGMDFKDLFEKIKRINKPTVNKENENETRN